jgi:hypothetical protein
MILSLYHDLLWDFAYEGAKRPSVTLRVFSSEQEMFEARRTPPTYPVLLPLDWLGTSKTSRAERARSRISPGMLMDVGRGLWEAIPPEANHPLLEALPDQPCRLKISSNSTVIDDLPWEWLNDGSGPPLALRPGIRLARSVPIRLAIPPMSLEPPLRVLLVITNPKDERLLNPYMEIEAVRPRLNAFPYSLRILEEPTWEAMVAALREEPHIMHYIGHAGISQGEGNLILHDSQDISHWILGPELARAMPLSVRLLCLSTCFTAQNYQILGLPRLAHTSAMYQLPTAVANRYPVAEASVRTFWEAFYSLLVERGGNVNDAFHGAQQAVAVFPGTEADWGSFSLVIRDQSGEVLRLETAERRSAGRRAEEIKAQLASRLANDLAARLRTYGAEAPESMQKQFEEEAAAASDFTKNI